PLCRAATATASSPLAAASTWYPTEERNSTLHSRTDSSSSTTSTVSEPRTSWHSTTSLSVLLSGSFPLMGKYMRKAVPLSGSLSTLIAPPLCFTIFCTSANPSPVPLLSDLVV